MTVEELASLNTGDKVWLVDMKRWGRLEQSGHVAATMMPPSAVVRWLDDQCAVQSTNLYLDEMALGPPKA